jgi:hypothetical protein
VHDDPMLASRCLLTLDGDARANRRGLQPGPSRRLCEGPHVLLDDGRRAEDEHARCVDSTRKACGVPAAAKIVAPGPHRRAHVDSQSAASSDSTIHATTVPSITYSVSSCGWECRGGAAPCGSVSSNIPKRPFVCRPSSLMRARCAHEPERGVGAVAGGVRTHRASACGASAGSGAPSSKSAGRV